MSTAIRHRELGELLTGFIVFTIGFGASLAGDACHIASGTTHYLWPDIPTLYRSAVWFPFLVAGAIVGLARLGVRARLPHKPRTRSEIVIGVAAVLALYALTAALRGQPSTVSVTLCSAIAVAIWAAWDASLRAFAIASLAAVLGPLAEISLVLSGASDYAIDARQLFGVAPWLPSLYFAAGAVSSGLWNTIARGDTAPSEPAIKAR